MFAIVAIWFVFITLLVGFLFAFPPFGEYTSEYTSSSMRYPELDSDDDE